MSPEQQIIIGLCSGIVGVIIGSIVGAFLTAKFTYGYQQRLLEQQLHASEQSHRELLAAQEKAHQEFLTFLDQKILVALLTRWNTTFQKEIFPSLLPVLNKAEEALDRVAADQPKTPSGA